MISTNLSYGRSAVVSVVIDLLARTRLLLGLVGATLALTVGA